MQTRGDIAKDVDDREVCSWDANSDAGLRTCVTCSQGGEWNGSASTPTSSAARPRAVPLQRLALAENLPKIVDSSSVSQDVE